MGSAYFTDELCPSTDKESAYGASIFNKLLWVSEVNVTLSYRYVTSQLLNNIWLSQMQLRKAKGEQKYSVEPVNIAQ